MIQKKLRNTSILLGISLFVLSNLPSVATCGQSPSYGPIKCKCTEEGPDPYSLGTYYTILGNNKNPTQACQQCAKTISSDATCTPTASLTH